MAYKPVEDETQEGRDTDGVRETRVCAQGYTCRGIHQRIFFTYWILRLKDQHACMGVFIYWGIFLLNKARSQSSQPRPLPSLLFWSSLQSEWAKHDKGSFMINWQCFNYIFYELVIDNIVCNLQWDKTKQAVPAGALKQTATTCHSHKEKDTKGKD